jgi:hypothetical protein
MRLLLSLILLVACKDHANNAVEQRELADEILTTARAFGKTMCACPDEACAQTTSERWQKWTVKASADLAALEQRQGETVKAGKQEIDEAFAAYEQCAIRFAIGRPLKGSAGN